MNKERVDSIFSIYIRLRDTDENGRGECSCCKKPLTYWASTCAHYIKRRHSATRYHEKNVAIECNFCNGATDDDLTNLGDMLIKRFGDNIIQELTTLKYMTVRMDKYRLKDIYDYYRGQCKKLLKTKNFTVEI